MPSPAGPILDVLLELGTPMRELTPEEEAIESGKFGKLAPLVGLGIGKKAAAEAAKKAAAKPAEKVATKVAESAVKSSDEELLKGLKALTGRADATLAAAGTPLREAQERAITDSIEEGVKVAAKETGEKTGKEAAKKGTGRFAGMMAKAKDIPVGKIARKAGTVGAVGGIGYLVYKALFGDRVERADEVIDETPIPADPTLRESVDRSLKRAKDAATIGTEEVRKANRRRAPRRE